MTTRSAGEPSAELLSWDSEFWGVRIARAPTLMDDWALDNTTGCMWILIPAHDQADIHRAEEGGARVMDIRVKLSRDPMSFSSRDRGIYAAAKTDTEWMVVIAREAFRGLTRFYTDSRFPDERCDDLYENWVRDSMDGWAAKVFVAPGAGFITMHSNEDEASIGLIAVADGARGEKIGTRLVYTAMEWASVGHNQITVVTQGCNTAALRTFQGCGFRTCQTDIWLHKWFYD